MRSKETRDQDPNFKFFGMLSIMHAYDALWISLFCFFLDFFRVPKLLFLGDRAVTKM